MEGTLERKHKLQLGGKKVRKYQHGQQTLSPQSAAHTLILFLQAASRGWNSYHAVLHRHTLCFYQDRKDTLRVSSQQNHRKSTRTELINN